MTEQRGGRGRMSEQSVEMVKEQTNIVTLIGEQVDLKRAGPSEWKGLCPFHSEKSPSFTVSESEQAYYCFGCGEGGDAISFVQQIEGFNFRETVEFLAEKFNVEIIYEESDRKVDDREVFTSSERARLYALNEATAAWFHRNLIENPQARNARDFMRERGFGAAEAVGFEVGYAPDSWDALIEHLTSEGFTAAEMVTAAVATEKKDKSGVVARFRNRLMWPIRDANRKVVGFGGRKLNPDEDGPKYLNTPSTVLYNKSKVLYGLGLVRRDIVSERQVVIVEGYSDVMAMHLSGVQTAVATCGTAFGAEHVNMLKGVFGKNPWRIVFAFDGDEAGRKAAVRSWEGLKDVLPVDSTVAFGPAGMDPCDIRVSEGPDGVKKMVASPEPLLKVVLNETLKSFDLSSAAGKSEAGDAAAEVLNQVEDRIVRDSFTEYVAAQLSLSVSQFKEDRKVRANRDPVKVSDGHERIDKVDAGDLWLLVAASRSMVTDEMFDMFPVDAFSSERAKNVWRLLRDGSMPAEADAEKDMFDLVEEVERMGKVIKDETLTADVATRMSKHVMRLKRKFVEEKWSDGRDLGDQQLDVSRRDRFFRDLAKRSRAAAGTGPPIR